MFALNGCDCSLNESFGAHTTARTSAGSRRCLKFKLWTSKLLDTDQIFPDDYLCVLLSVWFRPIEARFNGCLSDKRCLAAGFTHVTRCRFRPLLVASDLSNLFEYQAIIRQTGHLLIVTQYAECFRSTTNFTVALLAPRNKFRTYSNFLLTKTTQLCWSGF